MKYPHFFSVGWENWIIKLLQSNVFNIYPYLFESMNSSIYVFQLHKIIGFTPVVMQIVMSQEVEQPVRQAAVIYLKNMVSFFYLTSLKCWLLNVMHVKQTLKQLMFNLILGNLQKWSLLLNWDLTSNKNSINFWEIRIEQIRTCF